MNVLIVSATEKEISLINKRNNSTLITGVGMVATTFHLTQHLTSNKYDLVLNVGIAGSFSSEIKKCELVNVIEDRFADLGAEDDEKFMDFFDMGLEEKSKFPFNEGVLQSTFSEKLKCLDELKKAKGISVNKVQGNEKSISKIKLKYNPDVETMEGAACFYVCAQKNIPCIQVRSISNFVEKRNRNNWDIEGAINSLNLFIQKFLDELSQCK